MGAFPTFFVNMTYSDHHPTPSIGSGPPKWGLVWRDGREHTLGGCIISAVVGFIGAFLGLWLSRQLGLPAPLTVTVDGEPFPILWSIIGSALYTAVLGFLSGRRRTA